MARQQLVEQRGTGISEVQLAGGAGSETGDPLLPRAGREICANAHDAMLRETQETQ
jgi:hypothetical protein